jgi:hypothetical protein
VFTCGLGCGPRDGIELVERQSLINIMMLTRRCIDVIKFLRLVSFDGKQSEFRKTLYDLSKEYL